MFGSKRYKTAKRNVRRGYKISGRSAYEHKKVYRSSSRTRKK